MIQTFHSAVPDWDAGVDAAAVLMLVLVMG